MEACNIQLLNKNGIHFFPAESALPHVTLRTFDHLWVGESTNGASFRTFLTLFYINIQYTYIHKNMDSCNFSGFCEDRYFEKR